MLEGIQGEKAESLRNVLEQMKTLESGKALKAMLSSSFLAELRNQQQAQCQDLTQKIQGANSVIQNV